MSLPLKNCVLRSVCLRRKAAASLASQAANFCSRLPSDLGSNISFMEHSLGTVVQRRNEFLGKRIRIGLAFGELRCECWSRLIKGRAAPGEQQGPRVLPRPDGADREPPFTPGLVESNQAMSLNCCGELLKTAIGQRARGDDRNDPSRPLAHSADHQNLLEIDQRTICIAP